MLILILSNITYWNIINGMLKINICFFVSRTNLNFTAPNTVPRDHDSSGNLKLLGINMEKTSGLELGGIYCSISCYSEG